MTEQALKDHVIFITGGNSGIGLDTALLFASKGANVVIFSRRQKENMIARNQIKALGVECLAFSGDVTREKEVKFALEKTIEKFGRLDYAFNNAAIEQMPNYLIEQSTEEFDRIMAINVKGVWLCMKHQLPYMVQSGGGAIVNHSSISGIVATEMVSALVASKHAVVGLTKSAALEYARFNVRINAICSAAVESPMLDRLIGNNPETRKQLDNYHALGRCAKPREISEAVYWLCSNNASFITGHPLIIDGGASIH